MPYEVTLQGSYKNGTNILGESDVDVLVEFKSIIRNPRGLSERELARFNAQKQSPSTATYDQFRANVVSALRERFGWNGVCESSSGKAFRITTPYRLADVVVCQTLVEYLPNPLAGYGFRTVQGICFYCYGENRWIVNYPQRHYLKGVAKNERTANRFKRTVRLFKNLRSELVDRRLISEKLVTSYFIECLLYNCNHSCFKPSLNETFGRVMTDLMQAYLSGTSAAFLCLNEQMPLFGDSRDQWSVDEAILFWAALVRYWESWRE
jgi:hypothetical protein